VVEERNGEAAATRESLASAPENSVTLNGTVSRCQLLTGCFRTTTTLSQEGRKELLLLFKSL
jgi:hypothetical protein